MGILIRQDQHTGQAGGTLQAVRKRQGLTSISDELRVLFLAAVLSLRAGLSSQLQVHASSLPQRQLVCQV